MEDEEWNSPNTIATDEYTSILKSFYELILRPIVQKQEKIDRDALEMIVAELQWTTNDENFRKLPFNTQNAYKSLAKLASTLKETGDATIIDNKDILDGHFLLGICCSSYGQFGVSVYTGRNPCRENQISMYSNLAKARRRQDKKSLPLIEASGEMFDVCKRCPYKA